MDLHPLGAGGLDYHSNKATARPDVFVTGEGIRLDTGALDRRKGDAKIYRASDPTNTKTCGTSVTYITIPGAAQLEIQEGGWALNHHFKALRPSGGNTAYVVSSRVAGQSYHVISVTLSDAGVLVVTVEFVAGGSKSITLTAVADDAVVHLLVIHDAPAGTMTAYVNGAADGTPITGLAASDKPVSGTGEDWHLAIHYDPSVPGVVANTEFGGAFQGFTLMSLRGLRPGSGVATFTSMLVKHSIRQWPLPYADFVLCCYDMIDTGLTVYDRSRFENTATAEGGTSDDPTAIANSVIITNHVGHVQRPDGTRSNVIGSSGRLFYEDVA